MVMFIRGGLLSNRLFIFLRPKNHGKNRNVLYSNSCSDSTTEHLMRVNLSHGKEILLSIGKYAKISNGCVTATFGDTSVLTAVVRAKHENSSSFLPLTVDYRQKAAATGRIPTNFFRRELGLTETEILTSRIIDRSLRPLFCKDYSYETQVICNLLAVDGINDPDIMCINAASAAISVSDIPWHGPVGAVRIGYIDKNYVINPTRQEMQKSTLNLIVSCTSSNHLVMLDGSADDILESELKKAVRLAAKECQLIVRSIMELQKKYGKPKIQIDKVTETSNFITHDMQTKIEGELRDIFMCVDHDKLSRDNAIEKLRVDLVNDQIDWNPKDTAAFDKEFNQILRNVFRSLILDEDIRCDGRDLYSLRPITGQVNLFNPLHGSAMFQRGQTQVLCTVTLDSIQSALKMDTVSMLTSGVKEKNFFLHYEFPPYAVNEIGKVTGISRRSVGHGALAEKGLRAVIPKDYPFTIRLTSEVLESNGSSSMASVCGGSLALMDAGVPITAPVAGVAIGLISKLDSENKIENYKILTDILGIEDHFGDMDFKAAGTKKGFTAIQVDVKLPGIPQRIVMESITRASEAKSQILSIMNTVLSRPNATKNDKHPVLEVIDVPAHQRAKFIGVGGANLKRILIETGVQIYGKNDTEFCIFAPNKTAMSEAHDIMDKILVDTEPKFEFGNIYTAQITQICENGVFIKLYPNMIPTLLHNSQLDHRKVHHASVLGLKIGEEIHVKYFGRDPVNGQMRLSRKVLIDNIPDRKTFFPQNNEEN